jgi:long-chain acyl-CoA synthetase
MAILKPTIFASVPRIYNRFYDAIKLNLSKLTGLKKKIAN